MKRIRSNRPAFSVMALFRGLLVATALLVVSLQNPDIVRACNWICVNNTGGGQNCGCHDNPHIYQVDGGSVTTVEDHSNNGETRNVQEAVNNLNEINAANNTNQDPSTYTPAQLQEAFNHLFGIDIAPGSGSVESFQQRLDEARATNSANGATVGAHAGADGRSGASLAGSEAYGKCFEQNSNASQATCREAAKNAYMSFAYANPPSAEQAQLDWAFDIFGCTAAGNCPGEYGNGSGDNGTGINNEYYVDDVDLGQAVRDARTKYVAAVFTGYVNPNGDETAVTAVGDAFGDAIYEFRNNQRAVNFIVETFDGTLDSIEAAVDALGRGVYTTNYTSSETTPLVGCPNADMVGREVSKIVVYSGGACQQTTENGVTAYRIYNNPDYSFDPGATLEDIRSQISSPCYQVDLFTTDANGNDVFCGYPSTGYTCNQTICQGTPPTGGTPPPEGTPPPGTPTPTPTPSGTPSPTPTPSGSPSPSPSGSPSPTPTPTPPPVGCNEPCLTDFDCVNPEHECHEGACRLSDNLDSASCSEEPSPTPTPNGTPSPTPTPITQTEAEAYCNEECTYNSDCANSNHICFEGRCRLDRNPESASCRLPVGSQPVLPTELPETGSEGLANFLKVGLSALGFGALIFLLL